MRRKGLAVALAITAVAGTGAAAALWQTRPSAHAGVGAPAVQIKRVQHAEFVPAERTKRPIFILAIGSDGRPGVCMPIDRCRADSLHLVGINTQRREASVVGFPRDSYVPIPGHGTDKINTGLFHGGPELMVRTVEELTGIRIDYYLLTSFDGLKTMVDALGGVNIEIPYVMKDRFAGTDFRPGLEHLDGREALAFTRDRHSGPKGDFSRSANQGSLIVAALRKLRKDFAADPASVFRWIAAGVRHIRTDLSFAEIFDLMLTATSVEPGRVRNVVMSGSTGFAGAASIVNLSASSNRIFKDLHKDGVLAGGKSKKR